MSETNSNKDFNLTIEEIDQLHTVISFLLENEQYGDDWEDEIELLKKIAAFADAVPALERLARLSFKK